VKHPGILASYGIGRKEAEDLILGARVVAGWISPEDLIREEAPAEEPAPAEGEPADADKAPASGG
ncbi:MAG: transcription termination/antitermination protein NusA, partial [Hyphomicrobiaceae bacterium]|nr:transcription termination/antitermination protein NusA [Hyphomicrobiaceae bacterium]